MSLSLIAVAALAFWDEEREAAADLEDFAMEQATLARSVAAGLRGRLAGASGDGAPAAGIADNIGLPGRLLLLVLPPGQPTLRTTDGRAVDMPKIAAALRAGRSYVRLSRDEAARLGLPPRTAMAGLASIDGGAGTAPGAWGVAAVASAERDRDRELRARWRLVFGVLLASGLVLAYGGIALRKQRKELELERELAVAALRQERDDRLVRASRAATMGTLAMGITHELATPLGVIAGRAEQLHDRLAGDERAVRGLETILSQVGHINQVIRGFLGLARGDGRQIQAIAPARVLTDALLLVEHRFAQAGITLAPRLPDGEDDLPCLRGEPGLLEHALVNLLLNACDASPPGGAVEVGVEIGPGRRDIVFCVIDHGAGFPPGGVGRALEPFFSTKPAGEGTGLGLAVANEIVKGHRGDLIIEPITPHGTRAAIRIPLPDEPGRSHA